MNIRNLVLILICFANCSQHDECFFAFCILALTSSSVPTFLLISFFLHVLMAVGEESEVIRKVQVLQLTPMCPLNPISSVFCSLFRDPFYGKQAYEW